MALFIMSAIALMGVIVLVSIYVSDKQSFNTILENLGNFGGFLSGIGTIIAAAAAAVGVDGWLKQLRVGKSIVVIWDVQVALRKVHAAEIAWYVCAYQRKDKSADKEHEGNLLAAIDHLRNIAHELDAIVINSQFEWANKVSGIYLAWHNIKTYLINHPAPKTPQEILTEHKNLAPINGYFSETYELYLAQLEALEKKIK